MKAVILVALALSACAAPVADPEVAAPTRTVLPPDECPDAPPKLAVAMLEQLDSKADREAGFKHTVFLPAEVDTRARINKAFVFGARLRDGSRPVWFLLVVNPRDVRGGELPLIAAANRDARRASEIGSEFPQKVYPLNDEVNRAEDCV